MSTRLIIYLPTSHRWPFLTLVQVNIEISEPRLARQEVSSPPAAQQKARGGEDGGARQTRFFLASGGCRAVPENSAPIQSTQEKFHAYESEYGTEFALKKFGPGPY